MNIDQTTLQQIEKLAKLNVGVEDQEITIKKIVSILDMLDKIDMNDLTDIEPLYHPLEISQPTREDKANSDIPRDSIQQQSPQIDSGLFLVPKVIE